MTRLGVRVNSSLFATCLLLLSTCSQTLGDEPSTTLQSGVERPRDSARGFVIGGCIARGQESTQPSPAPANRDSASTDPVIVQLPPLPADPTSTQDGGTSGMRSLIRRRCPVSYSVPAQLGEPGEDSALAQAAPQPPGSTTPRVPPASSGVPAQGTTAPRPARPSAPTAPAAGTAVLPPLPPLPGATAAPGTTGFARFAAGSTGSRRGGSATTRWRRGNSPAGTETDRRRPRRRADL